MTSSDTPVSPTGEPKLRCPYAGSDMTPCARTDGVNACTEGGVCVGCGRCGEAKPEPFTEEDRADLRRSMSHESARGAHVPADAVAWVFARCEATLGARDADLRALREAVEGIVAAWERFAETDETGTMRKVYTAIHAARTALAAREKEGR